MLPFRLCRTVYKIKLTTVKPLFTSTQGKQNLVPEKCSLNLCIFYLYSGTLRAEALFSLCELACKE